MRRTLLKSKLHRAVVTDANLHSEGSLGLDEDLLAAADLIPYEKVHVSNITNGERFSTYVIREKAGSGKVSVYGAEAPKAQAGDVLIVVTYVQLEDEEIEFHVPKVVFLDPGNRPR
ncbi:MAG: aspartate 1-decarboxylase [Candidatus Aminicenantes bacterium]|nr:aspartate 1-decarboxylase [Candidatus Aminicenantes bacterium]